MSKNYYVTTTLPYVNARLHAGHAMEFVRADTFVRHLRSLGNVVFFNTGSDEHGQKIFETALAQNIDTKTYCDNVVAEFKKTLTSLNISKDIHFTRTTDKHHIEAAQHFWKIVPVLYPNA